MEVSFDDREARAFMAGILERAKKIKGAADKYVAMLSAIVFKDVMDHFENERGEKGAWPKWSKAYTEHMKKIGRGGNKMLQFNGRLRQNFTPQKYQKKSDGILWFNNAKTRGGFPYAYGHNEGEGKLPKRDFMWASEKAVEKMAEQTLTFMVEEKL
jgi:phage gpG-like protein